jgi:hypothetical protein
VLLTSIPLETAVSPPTRPCGSRPN